MCSRCSTTPTSRDPSKRMAPGARNHGSVCNFGERLGGKKWWVGVLGHYSNSEWRRPQYYVLDCAFSLVWWVCLVCERCVSV